MSTRSGKCESPYVHAEDAKPGHWYVRASTGERMLCCDSRTFWTPRAATFTLECDVAMIPLPNCDGWGWQPPQPEKQYRAFATVEEWWPHRDRWVRCVLDRVKLCWRGEAVAEKQFMQGFVFLNDDGTDAEPFGVEVTT